MSMTFEQFQSTRTETSDVGAILNDSALKGQPAFLYCGCLYIDKWTESWTGHPAGRFAYHLVIERDEWCSNDLTELEHLLYDFAVSEGYDAEHAA